MKMAWFERTEELMNNHARTVAAIVAISGLVWRLYYSSIFYLNPDEAMHYTLAATDWHGLVGFYRHATRTYHPPLFLPVLQGMLFFGRSEWLLRLVPALAGALFPWFIMLWLQRFTSNAAALCAQLLLTFSPSLIILSTEVRAYTLAFLFFSICLLLLEEALDRGSSRCMIWCHVFLYLAILSEYCVIWFVGALGIYALLRLWKGRASRDLTMVWVLGQLLALGLYLFLYFTHVSQFSHSAVQDMYSTWLQDGIPQSHQNLLVFALKGTRRQFSYLFQVRWLAWAGVIIFPLGVLKLWKDRFPLHATLLVLPFCLACLGAILHLFPYGETRHSAILGIAIAASLGVAIASLTKKHILPILAAALPVIFIWNAIATDPSLTIPRYRRQLSDMRGAIAFLKSSVPPGSVIVTDIGTDLTLGYYLGCPDYEFESPDEPYRVHPCANWRFVVAPTFQFSGPSELRKALEQSHARYHSEQQLWAATGGFSVAVATPVSESRSFGKTIAIFTDSGSPVSSMSSR
jgi:4-amino-4-deoxy-L-arabinose transferase-like glycosyltransferase